MKASKFSDAQKAFILKQGDRGTREAGEVVVFLTSDKASYVTGQVIAADGGFESTGVGLPALRG